MAGACPGDGAADFRPVPGLCKGRLQCAEGRWYPCGTGYKIRDARLNRIPYMLIVGEKEESDKTISVRSRGEGEQGSCTVETFVNRVLDEIQRKAR